MNLEDLYQIEDLIKDLLPGYDLIDRKDKNRLRLLTGEKVKGKVFNYREGLGLLISTESMNFSYSRKKENIVWKVLKYPPSDDGSLSIINYDTNTFKRLDFEQIIIYSYKAINRLIYEIVIDEIEKKHGKGVQYCKDKILNIFIYDAGQIDIKPIKDFLRKSGAMFEYYTIFFLKPNTPHLTYVLVNLNPQNNFYTGFEVTIDKINLECSVKDLDLI